MDAIVLSVLTVATIVVATLVTRYRSTKAEVEFQRQVAMLSHPASRSKALSECDLFALTEAEQILISRRLNGSLSNEAYHQQMSRLALAAAR